MNGATESFRQAQFMNERMEKNHFDIYEGDAITLIDVEFRYNLKEKFIESKQIKEIVFVCMDWCQFSVSPTVKDNKVCIEI